MSATNSMASATQAARRHERRGGAADVTPVGGRTFYDGGDKAVPDRRHSLDEPWLLAIVAERRPQAVQRRVDAVIEVDMGVGPEPRSNLVAGDHLPWRLE